MSDGSYLVVFNECSGKGKLANYKKIICERLENARCKFNFIDINVLKHINIEEYNTIIIAGGDGTILEALPLLVNTDLKLGVVPCGTANLFAASLCIPKNINKSLDIILSDKITTVDIGKAGSKYFSLRVGFGYDASIIKGASRNLKKKLGYLAYFIQGIVSSVKLSQKKYKICIDGKSIDIDANSIIVANAGNMFKRFFTVAPKGSLKDGKLDIFILMTKNFREFLGVFFRIIFGIHSTNNRVMYTQASNITIESNERNIHIDGEYFNDSRVDIKVIPEALKVIVP